MAEILFNLKDQIIVLRNFYKQLHKIIVNNELKEFIGIISRVDKTFIFLSSLN